MLKNRSKYFVAAVLFCTLGVTAGCAPQTGSTTSRVEIYQSLDDITAASAIVVVGTIESQETVRDIDDTTPFTISTVKITKQIAGDAVATSVQVRQLGGDDLQPPTPIMEKGKQYLLYLTASGLAEPLDSQFYVTGANAGTFVASVGAGRSAGELTFTQVDPEPGEGIPTKVSEQDAVDAGRS